jgi:hypothetical protein
MKRIILLLTISLLLLFGFALAQQGTDVGKKQGAVVDLTDKTKVGGEILLGKYYFDHDDSRMARGEPCMYIFSYEDGKQGKLVASFHCTPVERPKSKDVILSLAMSENPNVFLLKEIQFKGDTKGHLVPAT